MNSGPLISKQKGMVRYRCAVVSRMFAAFAGGYVLSAAFAAAMGLLAARGLGMAKADAVTLSTMLSFIVFAVAVLWAFACRSALRAWVGIALPAGVLAGVAWMLYGGQV